MRRRPSARLAALSAGLLLAFTTPALRAQLTIDQAMAAASGTGPGLPATDVLAIAERWPSPNFDPIPWRVLPRDAALQAHAKARFFDAVLADLEEAAFNEQLAMAFVRFERARGSGQAPAGAVLDLERRYLDLLQQRDATRLARQVARSLLAIAMRTPGQLPAELEEPVIAAAEAADSGAAEPRAAIRTASEADRLHARRLMRGRAALAAGSELAAARKRLEHAEEVQDGRRSAHAQPGGSGLDLGDAMAAVAQAQFALRRAELRAQLFADVAAVLERAAP